MPPLNQYDAAATDLRDMFTGQPDFSPYDFVQPTYVAKAKKSWKKLTRGIDFSSPDEDEVRLRLAIQRSEGLPRRAQVVHIHGPPPGPRGDRAPLTSAGRLLIPGRLDTCGSRRSSMRAEPATSAAAGLLGQQPVGE